MKQSNGRPIPDISDLTRPFWTAASQGDLLLPTCSMCGTRDFLPKPWCIECGSRDMIWEKAKGTGTVYAHSTATAVMMNLPGWKDEMPLVLALVDLDEGARMYARLTHVKPEDVSIGLRVKVEFERVTDEIAVPTFRPY